MQDHLESFQTFRQAIYRSFPYRRDSLLDLLDALSSNERARSPVEVSLNPLFRRQYSALYRAITDAYDEQDYPVCSLEAYHQGHALLEAIPLPSHGRYRVFGIDETPCERLYAQCLRDRQTIHRSTPVPGQLPISVGHNYSILGALPDVNEADWSRWAVPILVERVSSLSNAITTAHHQIAQLMSYPLAQEGPLTLITVDSRYPTPAFLYGLATQSKVVVIGRVRRNRVFYTQPDARLNKTRPRWYGERFDLKDSSTWPPPTEECHCPSPSGNGKTTTLHIRRWSKLLMKGTKVYPMHRCPFDLVSIQRLDEAGETYGHPMWLLIWGEQRHTLSALDCHEVYRSRFNLEHFLGFAKPNLLLAASQASKTPHEINWVRLSCLAYAQLYLARRLVSAIPVPWQRYLPQNKTSQLTPRSIQRGFSRLMSQIGTIAAVPKPRGISPGRRKGTRLTPRAPCPLTRFHPPTKRCPCKDEQDAA